MEENNKLIAEFLGWEKIYLEGCVEYILPESLTDPIYKLDSRFILEFDSNWNWLMEVVEKITSILMLDDNYKYNYLYIGYDFEDNEHYVNLYVSEDTQLNGSSKNSKIEATYEAVVNFINFYNKQKEE